MLRGPGEGEYNHDDDDDEEAKERPHGGEPCSLFVAGDLGLVNDYTRTRSNIRVDAPLMHCLEKSSYSERKTSQLD